MPSTGARVVCRSEINLHGHRVRAACLHGLFGLREFLDGCACEQSLRVARGAASDWPAAASSARAHDPADRAMRGHAHELPRTRVHFAWRIRVPASRLRHWPERLRSVRSAARARVRRAAPVAVQALLPLQRVCACASVSCSSSTWPAVTESPSAKRIAVIGSLTLRGQFVAVRCQFADHAVGVLFARAAETQVAASIVVFVLITGTPLTPSSRRAACQSGIP